MRTKLEIPPRYQPQQIFDSGRRLRIVVGIDEAQSRWWNIHCLQKDLAKQNVYGRRRRGLRYGFQSNPFGLWRHLWLTAEYVTQSIMPFVHVQGQLGQSYSFEGQQRQNWYSWRNWRNIEPLSRAAYYKAMLKKNLSEHWSFFREVLPPQKKTEWLSWRNCLEIENLRALQHNYHHLRSKINPVLDF